MSTATALRLAGSEETAGAGVAWSLSGDITANNASPRTTTFTIDDDASQQLRGFNFGFDLEATPIPDDATVVGVEVQMSRAFDEIEMDGDVRDQAVQLLKDDGAGGRALVGQTRAMSGAWALGSLATNVLGGAGDDWGAGLTGADVKHANFGAALIAKGQQDPFDIGGFEVVGKVDWMAIRVHWEEAQTAARGRGRTRRSFMQGVFQ